MKSYNKQESDHLLRMVEARLDADPCFSKSQHAELQEMLNAWRGWVALKGLGKWLLKVLGLAAAAYASWSVLSKGIMGLFR